MKNILTITLSSFLLAGCVIKQDYPSSWKNIEPSTLNECSKISGKYQEKGILHEYDYISSLSDILLPSSQKSIDSLNLKVNDKFIEIEMLSNMNRISKDIIEIDGKKVSCKNGAIIIDESKFLNNGGATAKEWKTYTLSKTSDGLVIKKENTTAGLFFLIPIVGKDTTWMLFKETKN